MPNVHPKIWLKNEHTCKHDNGTRKKKHTHTFVQHEWHSKGREE